mmetsp:Transcript_26076/g.34226  ORF Transcript_26076/g.34226 Transcript_26076/m.34226 type:complete len:109 (+) Transcript_26076:140-466(+)
MVWLFRNYCKLLLEDGKISGGALEIGVIEKLIDVKLKVSQCESIHSDNKPVLITHHTALDETIVNLIYVRNPAPLYLHAAPSLEDYSPMKNLQDLLFFCSLDYSDKMD